MDECGNIQFNCKKKQLIPEFKETGSAVLVLVLVLVLVSSGVLWKRLVRCGVGVAL